MIDMVVQFQKHRNNSVVLVFDGARGEENIPLPMTAGVTVLSGMMVRVRTM
jgi:hypothetical protein